MKKYLFFFFLFVALPLVAYQAGQAGRANFGSAAQQPAAQTQGYRSFTNSGNKWRQGVQTQTVQTSRAGSAATEFEPVEQKAPVGKKTVAAAPAAANKPAVPAAASTQPSTGTAAMPANVDPAAIMQQAMQGMPDMAALMGGAAANNGQKPAASAGQNAAASAMPDISALMGGMMPGAVPAAAPTPAPTKKKI